MSPTSQNEALAKFCEWKQIRSGIWLAPKGSDHEDAYDAPNYSGDANLLRDVKERLSREQAIRFAQWMMIIVIPERHEPSPEPNLEWFGLARMLHASPEQEAMALLHALGLWVDDEVSDVITVPCLGIDTGTGLLVERKVKVNIQ